jgi:sigma-B regulation protein RsbU (phosphoserine phosphatase)
LLNSQFTYQSAVSIFSNSLFNAAAFIEVVDEPGGDFYDFYETPDGNTSFIIGDVSGKGQVAADYMRETKKVFHSIVKENLLPADLINKLNDSVAATYDKLHFVTLTYLQIDIIQKQFSYIRAGHCPLLYYSAAKNTCEYFEDKGIGLGIIRDNVFSAMMHEYKMNFGSNDVLVLFTDGLIEAVDELSKNSFTMDALSRTLLNHKEHNAQDICDGILNSFRSVIHSQKSPDDLALIVIKFV